MTTSNTLRLFLVTGGTGVQGGAVIRALLQPGHQVRTVTRTPDSEAAQRLRALGVDVVGAAWEDTSAMEQACRGVDALFLHTVPWYVGAPREPELAMGVARAAERAGVRHLVFSSAAGADHGSGFVVLESKHTIEQQLRTLSVPTTVVAPAFLMDNFLAPLWFGGIADGRLPVPLPAERSLQLVAIEEVAQLVAQLLEEGAQHHGRRIPVASDVRTIAEIAAILSRHAGRTVTYEHFPMEQVEAMNPQLVLLFRWLDQRGHGVDVARVTSEFPNVGWRTLETWAAAQDWSVLDRAPPPPAHDHDH